MELCEEKRRLRKAVRARAPSAAERAAQSERLCHRLLRWPQYQRAGCLAAYVPLPHEANILPVLEDALHRGKRLLLPRVDAAGMTFHETDSLAALCPGAYGVLEPSADAPRVALREASLLLIPLEAVDDHGRRLGKGGGYYDRVLAESRGFRLGIALTHQVVPRVPVGKTDQPLDGWITPDSQWMIEKAREQHGYQEE